MFSNECGKCWTGKRFHFPFNSICAILSTVVMLWLRSEAKSSESSRVWYSMEENNGSEKIKKKSFQIE